MCRLLCGQTSSAPLGKYRGAHCWIRGFREKPLGFHSGCTTRIPAAIEEGPCGPTPSPAFAVVEAPGLDPSHRGVMVSQWHLLLSGLWAWAILIGVSWCLSGICCWTVLIRASWCLSGICCCRGSGPGPFPSGRRGVSVLFEFAFPS